MEQLDDELTTKGGFVLPESSKDKPIKGTIIAIGVEIPVNANMTWDISEDLKVGDRVVFKKWSTTDFEEDGKKLAFVAFGDILGVYED